jgi:hypothetical protein
VILQGETMLIVEQLVKQYGDFTVLLWLLIMLLVAD